MGIILGVEVGFGEKSDRLLPAIDPEMGRGCIAVEGLD